MRTREIKHLALHLSFQTFLVSGKLMKVWNDICKARRIIIINKILQL